MYVAMLWYTVSCELAEADRGALALLVSLRPFQEEGKVLGMPLNVAGSCM